jgi:hypothetical protein
VISVTSLWWCMNTAMSIFQPTTWCLHPHNENSFNKTGNVRINITSRNVNVTFVPWKSNKYYIECVCVCVCVALVIQHAMCMHHTNLSLWPVWLYHIFSYYLINDTIFRKKCMNIKCMFWISLQRLSETFLILRSIQWDIIKNVRKFSCKVHVILVRF